MSHRATALSFVAIVASAAAAFVGCSSGNEGSDPAAAPATSEGDLATQRRRHDAGTTQDAGGTSDAGNANDTGSSVDSGTSNDSGGSADTGTTAPDAGTGSSCTYTSIANTPPPAGGRNTRLYLTSGVTARLKQRAAANDASWTALKARCDGLATGTANAPNANAYPDFPNVGQGYQGDGYLPEIMNLGLCYRVVEGVDAAASTKYGAAGARLLEAMATPVASGGESPSTDSGYGIRNFGVGMATGFDWLYPALSDATKQKVITSLHLWIDWYDTSGFSRDAPIGNYFAGYLLAKTTAAIALEGDDAKATTYWDDVENHLWAQLVKPQFTASMAGGGWPEGWQYGPRSVQNYIEFLWAAETGKGKTFWQALPQAADQARYISYFTWPSLLHMDDQGTVHSQDALRPSAVTASALAMMLEYNCDPYASTARSFANDLLATKQDVGDAWQAFLFWDPSLTQAPYTQNPLSYFARGPNHVAMRSSWQKDATWASFVSGQYIDAQDSGEQYFNQGSIAVVQGDQPILVNATGWLPQAAGDPGESFVYDDTWANETRLLNNTFYVAGAHQDSADPSTSSTHVDRYEEGGSYVHSRGVKIEQMYGQGAVTQFTRELVYVRPNVFVVYDRTTIPNASTDQWLAWHTPGQPTSVATTDATQRRYDIKAGSATIGSVRTLLPRNAVETTTSILSGAAWRLESHASQATATQDWLTVVTSGGAVPEQKRLSAADGNVTSGAIVGVHVLGARNAVVLFGTDHAGAALSTSADYLVAQTSDADHVLLDVAPSGSGYAVTATPSGGGFAIHVQQGGSHTPSANGTLSFVVTASGAVQ